MDLSTTAYAILGMLSVEAHSAYELATQLTRGWSFIWPRAERGFYSEPKKLVQIGLARARTERRGLRARTVYTITPAGRRALREWLKRESAPPVFEAEGLVRLAFSENGTPKDLMRAIGSLRLACREVSVMGAGVARGYLDGTGLYPQRLHLIALMGRFMAEYVRMLDRYATWAETEVSGWKTTTNPGEFEDNLGEMRRALATFERHLSRQDGNKA